MNILVWKLSEIAAQENIFSLTFFTFEVPFNGLFAPTSQSRMPNIYRDSESLGKSNGKKWSNIWTFFFGSGLKSLRKKKFFFFCWFCLGPPSYGIGATIRIGREMLCLLYAGFLLKKVDSQFQRLQYMIFGNQETRQLELRIWAQLEILSIVAGKVFWRKCIGGLGAKINGALMWNHCRSPTPCVW